MTTPCRALRRRGPRGRTRKGISATLTNAFVKVSTTAQVAGFLAEHHAHFGRADVWRTLRPVYETCRSVQPFRATIKLSRATDRAIGMGVVIELSDEQWDRVADLFDQPGRHSALAQIPRRQVVDAMLFLARTDCQWRYLPERFSASFRASGSMCTCGCPAP